MATAATEIKPDFSAPKRHFCITDEHEQLRESIETFCAARAGAPLRRVGGERISRLGVQADGRAGLPRRVLPRGVRRPGRRLLHVADARRGDGRLQQRRPGDGHRGPHRHGDAADPQVRLGVPQADLPRAVDQGRDDLLARHHRAGRRLRRRRHPHARGARRRRVRDQRLQDVHHERRARRLHRAGHEDRLRRGLRRLLAVRRAEGHARASTCRASSRSSGCTPPTPRS